MALFLLSPKVMNFIIKGNGMKKTALLFMLMTVFAVSVHAQETVEISDGEKQAISEELDKKAAETSDSKTRIMLQKVSNAFKKSKDKIEVEIQSLRENDCVDCSRQSKVKSFFKKLGQKLGKGAAWLSTATAKPFMTATGFVTGVVEKKDKNQNIVAMYEFFLNHQEEFDDLYLEAGTPEEMVELMLMKVEAILEHKSRILMKEYLLSLGIDRDLTVDFELSTEELAKIDLDNLDPSFINNHPEYQELRPILGDLTKEEVTDIVTSGYFSKSISFNNVKEALPKPYELAATVAAQIVVPQMALGIISKTVAGLYATPVIAADIGTGISAAICLQPEIRSEFETDKELKSFCSYVTNRSSYQLMKSRAKGYISGKKVRLNISEKIRARREKKEKEELEEKTKLN